MTQQGDHPQAGPVSDWDAPARARGRGARSNETGRYERLARAAAHDGWDLAEDVPPLRTEQRVERPRSALTRNTSPDLPFDRSVNPYRGCEHGCVYCFARPSHAWLGLSPGLDFETKLTVRPGIAEILAGELRRKSYRPAPIAIGTNTDPYQPVEGERRVMRAVLEVLDAFQHPVMITTKGTLIERDLDILAPMAARGLVQVGLSVTTLDADLARSMEPRVPSPARRLRTVAALADAGVPVRVCASPLIPGLTDWELDAILSAGRQAGATAASSILLRLPREVAPLFREWLQAARPDRFARVMGQVRAAHGGKEYDSRWHSRLRGQGAAADLLRQWFRLACRRLGLAEHLPPLRCDLFAAPPQKGDQLSLF